MDYMRTKSSFRIYPDNQTLDLFNQALLISYLPDRNNKPINLLATLTTMAVGLDLSFRTRPPFATRWLHAIGC